MIAFKSGTDERWRRGGAEAGVDAAAVKLPGDIQQALHAVLSALQEQLPSLQALPSSEAQPTKVCARCCPDRHVLASYERLAAAFWLPHTWRQVALGHAIQ